jgi:hypothetical protein
MPRILRYAAGALLLLGVGGLTYYLIHPGGVPNAASQSSQAVRYEPVAGYGDGCERFSALSLRDDFGSPPSGWVGADPSKVSFAPGRLVIKPAARESVVWLDPSIEYQRGFVCAKVQAAAQAAQAQAAATNGLEEGAGVAFWAVDPDNYYAAIIYRDGGYGVFRKVNGVVAPLVPKRPSAAVKIGNDDVNVVQVLYSEPRYAVLINGQPAASFELPSGSKKGMIGLAAQSARDKASEWTFSGIAAGSDQPLRKGAQ